MEDVSGQLVAASELTEIAAVTARAAMTLLAGLGSAVWIRDEQGQATSPRASAS